MKRKVSILYKEPDRKINTGNLPSFIYDLNIDKVVDISYKGKENFKKKVLLDVLSDTELNDGTAEFRADILQDFIRKQQLMKVLFELVKDAAELREDRQRGVRITGKTDLVYKLSADISVLLKYLKLLEDMNRVFQSELEGIKSEGLKMLADFIKNSVENGEHEELISLLSKLTSSLRGSFNLKIRITLDGIFKLNNAVLEEISLGNYKAAAEKKQPEKKQSILKTMFTKGENDVLNLSSDEIDFLTAANIDEVKEKVLQHFSMIISTYTGAIDAFFTKLESELIFYDWAMELVKFMKSHDMPMCRAEIANKSKRIFEANGLYDLSFAMYMVENGAEKPMEVIVTNSACIGDEGRILVITGPNQGGKTTFIRSIGIAQLLAQAGLPVPAVSAKTSPADTILTHFPVEERPDSNEGRLGEELARFADIMRSVTCDSLVIMNESFATTNSKEGSHISEDILKALSIAGTRVLFVTHLYELASRIDEINKEISGKAGLVSMAACVEEQQNENCMRRTYKIIKAPPVKTVFAGDIAKQYGLDGSWGRFS